jgi:bacterioferritin-associated ferredoxin
VALNTITLTPNRKHFLLLQIRTYILFNNNWVIPRYNPINTLASYIGQINHSNLLRVWLRLWPLSAIFQLYRGGQLHLWRKLEYPEKTTDLLQVTDNFVHITVVSITPRLSEIATLVVIGSDCTGSCKSNYHMITTTTVRPIVKLYILFQTVRENMLKRSAMQSFKNRTIIW